MVLSAAQKAPEAADKADLPAVADKVFVAGSIPAAAVRRDWPALPAYHRALAASAVDMVGPASAHSLEDTVPDNLADNQVGSPEACPVEAFGRQEEPAAVLADRLDKENRDR